MAVDRWLNIVGLIGTLVGLWLARYYYLKSVRSKRLAIAYTNPIPLMLPVEGVTVSYLGKEHSLLSRVFVLLWNRGPSPIEAADFIRPVTVRSADKVLL